MRFPTSPAGRLAPLLVLLAAACGSGSSSSSDFVIRTTSQAASPSAAIVLAGDWLVYFASETFSGALSTDLNGDGDTLDQVAFAVNLRSRAETNLGVAAEDAAIVGAQIYLRVDESEDGTDYNGDLQTDDIVLLHWSEAAALVTFVDRLDTGAHLVVVGDLLYYGGNGPALGVPDETSLRYVDEAAPTTPVAVLAEVGGLFARGGAIPVVEPVAERAGLLFCVVDETENGQDYNNDADALDPYVLVLLDGSDPDSRLKNVALAMGDDDEPLAARAQGAGDWLVAFLVDETAQGATNLNNQALFSQPLLPENCPASDADTNDRVLHYLEFADFYAGLSTPVNTGLAGHLRVLTLDGFVATISDEDEASCNLNAATGDGDTDDDVARWVATTIPIAPARSGEDLHALATAVGGGSFGLAALDERLIAVIDEAADSANLDGKVANHELVAWLDPAASNPTWRFQHQSSSNRGIGTGVFDSDDDSEPFAGTSWMAAEPVGDRLGLVFLEEVPGTNPNVGSLNTNLDCALVQKDSDKVDGLPVWADFESGPILDFDGVGFAVDEANAGIEIAGGFAFFRVSEADDNRDYNGDGQLNDVVLFRNPLTTCGPVAMATSSLVPGQVVTTDGVSAAAFLSSETQAGVDFNGDGDTTDLVVRYFRF